MKLLVRKEGRSKILEKFDKHLHQNSIKQIKEISSAPPPCVPVTGDFSPCEEEFEDVPDIEPITFLNFERPKKEKLNETNYIKGSFQENELDSFCSET